MAGNYQIVGWNGTPQYREYPPQVSYAPVYNDNVFDRRKKTLTRTLLCRRIDAQTLIGGLKDLDNDLVYTAYLPNGVTQQINYGAGWKLKKADEAPAKTADMLFSQINIEYEKEIVSAFDIALPTGLAMLNDGGTGKITFNNTVIYEFDPEIVDNGKGWSYTSQEEFTDFASWQSWQLGSAPWYISYARWSVFKSISITFNGQEVFTVHPNPEDFVTRTQEYNMLLRKGTKEEYSKFISNIDNFRESIYAEFDLDESAWVQCYSMYEAATGKAYGCYFVTKGTVQLMEGGSNAGYVNDGFSILNQWELQWDTSTANRIKLLYGPLTVFDFDVTGL